MKGLRRIVLSLTAIALAGIPCAGIAAAASATAAQFDRLEIAVVRAEDVRAIKNLQRAYGYYAEKSLWSDMAQLFTADGVLEIDGTRIAGSANILGFLNAMGPQGPVKDALNSQLQLQPVINVDAEGRTAKMRSRLLQLARDAEGRPIWGGGIYENELVKEDGVWRFKSLHLDPTYQVLYKNGWAAEPQR